VKARMVVLLVDALGWNLASGSAALARVLPHRRRLDTILGFSSGALPTLLTGRMPAEHGRWLMYRRAGSRTGGAAASPFPGFGWLGLLPERVRRSWKLGRLLRSLVGRRVRGYFDLYQVPRELLPEFDLAEREDLFAPGGLPGGGLWEDLERRGLRWRAWSWRTPENEALAGLERRLAQGDEALLFCYTADLDALLHREGSGGTAVRQRVERYAAWLEGLAAAAATRGEQLWLYLLSDHGMVDVRATVDPMALLRRLPFRWPRDYLAFFDSTMARFWWRAARARAAVRAALEQLPGHWLSAAELERSGCRFPQTDYGEDVFLLDPGVLAAPSFMGSQPVAAMHGYDPAHPDMAALLWSNRPVPEHVSHLIDVRAYLVAELEALRQQAAA
jgi:type I phosphodiesterase/nucleotide pyrophosphatase